MKIASLIKWFCILFLISTQWCCNGGPLVQDVLDKFEKSANNILNQATRDGDALTMRLANQMEIASQNMLIQFDGRYRKAIRDLNDQEQKIFSELQNMQDLAEKGIKQVQRTEELFNLDLIELTNRFKFITNKTPFYVSSINGIWLFQNKMQQTLEIVGIGFGYSVNRIEYKVELLLNNKLLPESAYTHKSDKELLVTIRNQDLVSFFNDTSVTFASAIFKVTKIKIDSKGNKRPLHVYTVPFKLTIFPKFAAKLSVQETTEVQVSKGENHFDLKYEVGASSTDHPNDWSQQWSCPGNCGISRVEFSKDASGASLSIGSGCGFCYNPGPGGLYDPCYSVDGKTVTIKRHCDGPSCTIYHRIYYYEYVDSPIFVMNPPQLCPFDQPFQIKLRPENTNHEFSIRGVDYLQDSIFVDNAITAHPQGNIEFLGSADEAGTFVVTFKITN